MDVQFTVIFIPFHSLVSSGLINHLLADEQPSQSAIEVLRSFNVKSRTFLLIYNQGFGLEPQTLILIDVEEDVLIATRYAGSGAPRRDTLSTMKWVSPVTQSLDYKSQGEFIETFEFHLLPG